MRGKVIQASFLNPHPMPAPPAPAHHAPPIQARMGARAPGPPTPAFSSRSTGAPAPAFASGAGIVQRRGAGGSFAIEPGQIGLAPGGGRPLPDAVRGKMEAALGADFSAVRVHVGPQAQRIGAAAFTVGSDIYFAPNRYQPNTIRGQQLLGHELAHVIQQRSGRVQNPFGSGLAVVRDGRLEAEADRLGQRAAAHRTAPTRAATHRATAQPKRITIQRASTQKTVTTSFSEDIYFAYHLTEQERVALAKSALINLDDFPIHGHFDPRFLNADLHVQEAPPGMNVSKKLKKALTKLKHYMEYAAAIRGANVNDCFVELPPTGGVVVKQMLELLAFVGRGFSEQLALKKKLDAIKEFRKYRIENALEKIAYLKRERARSGADLILRLITLHPEVDAHPSPGMAELIRDARAREDEIKALEAFVGERTSKAMGSAFFEEHLYMLQALIDRGKPGYFTVTSRGLANDLDMGDPHRQEMSQSPNVLLENSFIGSRARELYRKRLTGQSASLLIRIYYKAMDDVISAIP